MVYGQHSSGTTEQEYLYDAFWVTGRNTLSTPALT
jgi:hypothetical protein